MSTSIRKVICFMAERSQMDVAQMTGEKRAREFAWPRQIAMWLSCEALPVSLPMIGRSFNRDHSTVLHARNHIRRLRASNPEVLYLTDHLLSELRSMSAPVQDAA